MNADRALIGQQRFVQESLGPRERFVHAASDDVQVRRLVVSRGCRSTWTLTFARPPARRQRPGVAQARAHALAAHVEIGGTVVDRRDDGFESEAADDARGRRPSHVVPADGRLAAQPDGRDQPGSSARCTTASTAARASLRAAPVAPVLTT